MRIALTLLLLVTSASAADMKPLPPVTDPDWKTWPLPTQQIGEQVQAAWRVLREHRPDKQYASTEESQAAAKAVEAAYSRLEENAEAACAVGAYYLARTQDDWERLMIGGTLLSLDEERGEAFFVWSLAKSQSVDALFPAVFHDACFVAEAQKVADLSGLYWILKTQKGAVFLPEYNWVIPTHDCLFYVFGRFGNEAVPYLRAALRDKDPYVRRNAAVVLGYFLDHESKGDLLILLKQGGVPALGAAFALGELGAKEAMPELVKLLSATEASDRLWAIYGLYEIRAAESLPAIEAALAKETDERVKQELTASIEYIKSKGTVTAEPLKPEELQRILSEAEKSIIPDLPFPRIEVSVTAKDLQQLATIRRLSIDEITDEGHHEFLEWHRVMKAAIRGGAVTR
ncbi:MAG: HEAT repeat domain-containing protein [Planctomycetaceae bacterium]